MMLVLGIGKCSAQPEKIDSTIRAVLSAHKVDKTTQNLLVAQAKFESGNYSNNLFKRNNNLFGMMHPKVRLTKSKGARGRAEGRYGYAQFASIEDSVEDMLLYLWDKKQTPKYKSAAEYVRFLKTNRFFTAPESHYLRGLKQYLN